MMSNADGDKDKINKLDMNFSWLLSYNPLCINIGGMKYTVQSIKNILSLPNKQQCYLPGNYFRDALLDFILHLLKSCT